MENRLKQWPIQIKLINPNHTVFNNNTLLIAADCTAFAYPNFFNEFIKDKVTLIGCPKLDDVNYGTKLTEIISNNDIKEIIVTRMEVPCCGGITYAVENAVKASGKEVKLKTYIISIGGEIIESE